MKYLLIKDKRRRVLYFMFEKRRKFLRALLNNMSFASLDMSFLIRCLFLKLPRDSSITRIRNRCVLTNRPRSVYRLFGLSRLMFRKYMWQGKLIGVKKSSW